MCATVRKNGRWKCYQGQKNVIFYPKGSSNDPFFFLFHVSMCPRFPLVFPAELNQKQYTSKEYYQTKGTEFYERWRVWRLKDWSCAAARGEGGTRLTNVYPQRRAAVLFRWKLHHQISEWHLHAGLKASVFAAVTRDKRPQNNLWMLPCERDPCEEKKKKPRGCFAFTVEMLSMKATPLKRLLSCPLKP